MSLYFEKKLLAAEIETTYGTDPTPTGADAVKAFDLNIVPFENTGVASRPATPYFRGTERIPAGTHVSLNFWVEAGGSGTAGTAPAYAKLLRAAGLAETLTALTDAAYDPVSAAFESATLYFNMDGQLHKLLGWRSNVKFEAMSGELPKFRFEGRALYTGPAAAAALTPDFSAYQKPLIVNRTNTPTFSLHAFAGVLRSLEIDLGQQVAFRDLVGAETVQITGRNPTGRAVIEAPALGTKDFFAITKGETIAALSLIHGTTGGHKVSVSAAKAKIQNPRYGNDSGVAMLEMDLDLLPSSGDDEVQFKVL